MVVQTQSAVGAASNGGNITFDLSMKLRQRLHETNDQKDRSQAKINTLSEQLQRMFTRAPKKPRDTEEQMESKIAKLEYQRTTHSLSLSQEKQLLRQIDVIKRSKKVLADYHVHEHAIQEKKNEIGSHRDTIRTVIAAIAELESALSKVELAKRLGCTTSELETRVVDCPADKIGHVIGKNGSSLRQLEQLTGVQIDVDKVGSKIHLQGSTSALDAAVREVENITLAVEETVELSAPVVGYFLSQRSAILNEIQLAHPQVHFDISRNSTNIHLRGRPDDITLAIATVKTYDVTTLTHSLSGRETGLVVGKGGSTVNRLVSDHNVSINVSSVDSDQTSTVEVTGPSNRAHAAMDEVKRILHENEEIEEIILVNAMQRNMFLTNAGAVLKEIQSSVSSSGGSGGVLLVFEKKDRAEKQTKEPSQLVIKASRSNMPQAMKLVKERIAAHEATVISISVHPNIIPAIIGKGGAMINLLRQEGEGVEIEVEKDTGVVRVQADDEETRQKVKEAIQKIVSENQVLNFDIEQNLIGLVLGDPGKEVKKKITEELGVWLGVDSMDANIILRGSQEKIEEASEILSVFISENYTDDFEILPEDESILFQGGQGNFMSKLESNHNVNANLRKHAHRVFVRGTKENVDAALEELKTFILGGEGILVCKLNIPESSIGMVIGKGGSNLSKLEKDFEGVKVDMLRGCNKMSIRGPTESVKNCRSDVITLLSTMRITDSVSIDCDQHELLTKPEVMRRITDGINVQVVLGETTIKIRGIPIDVRDSKVLLMEQLTGIFMVYMDLDTSQLSRVSKAVRDISHFDRITESTKAKVSLDESMCAVKISGKRAHVKKAKNQISLFFDFLLPGEFAKVKVPKPVLRHVSEPSALAKVAAESGAAVFLDRELSCIQVRSLDPEEVSCALKLLQKRVVESEKLNKMVRYDPSDSWLMPKIIGKGGENVRALQDEAGCSVDVYRDDIAVAISGPTEEAVLKTKEALDNLVDQARKECVFIDIPDSAMPAFIGKAGSNIKKLAEDNNVDIERMRKDPSRVRILGKEAFVQVAETNILKWLNDWESKNIGISIPVEKSLIPAVLGRSGSTINAIQQESGCRIDIDRKTGSVTIRGGAQFDREEAVHKIQNIIAEEMEKVAAAEVEMEEKKKAAIEEKEKMSKDQENVARNENAKHKNAQKSEDEMFKLKDRSSEFLARPIGMSSVVKTAAPSNSEPVKKTKKTPSNSEPVKKTKKMPSNSEPVKKTNKTNGKGAKAKKSASASSAGMSLFSMLVSDAQPDLDKKSNGLDDSSQFTMSSGTDEESSTEIPQKVLPPPPPAKKSFYKSSGGLSIRL